MLWPSKTTELLHKDHQKHIWPKGYNHGGWLRLTQETNGHNHSEKVLGASYLPINIGGKKKNNESQTKEKMPSLRGRKKKKRVWVERSEGRLS